MSDTCINKEFNIKYANAKKMMIPKELGRYTLQKLIMQSPKCVVVSSIFPGTTEKVAIKCIPIEIFKKIAKEDDIMKQINHPNIIKYYDSFMYPNQNPRFFAIVMARGVDDLYNYVERNGPLHEEIVCQIMRQALNAVSYLHSNQIWHRDLKLDNILLMEEARNGFKIAITDFGLSDNFNCDEYTGKCCGTLEYAAPELVQNLYGGLCFKLRAVYSNKIDIWSMGVAMYALLSKSIPFDPCSQYQIEKLFEGEVNFDAPDEDLDEEEENFLENFKNVSEEAKNLIRQMLCPNPEERISAEEALADPWFQMFENNAEAPIQGNDNIFNAIEETQH